MTQRGPGVRSIHPRILLVDDDAKLIRAYERLLGREHQVVTAHGAHAALARLAADQAFQVILCDLMMPGLSGVEFYYAVCDRWPELASRVVFCTGGVFTDAAEEFLASVPNVWVQKPFSLPHLRATIARVAAGPGLPDGTSDRGGAGIAAE